MSFTVRVLIVQTIPCEINTVVRVAQPVNVRFTYAILVQLVSVSGYS